MAATDIIEATIAFVKSTLDGMDGSHDYFHIERVYKVAKLTFFNDISARHEISKG